MSRKTQLSRLGQLGSRLLLAEGQQQGDTDMNRHFDSEKDRERRWVTLFFTQPVFLCSCGAQMQLNAQVPVVS